MISTVKKEIDISKELHSKIEWTCTFILNKEKVLSLEKKHWCDSTIDKIINNKIYMGDYRRYKYDTGKETECSVSNL